MKRKDVKKLELVNARDMSKEHPDQFFLPPKESLDSIKAGMLVKVCALGERFWVETIEDYGDGIFIGRVDNYLVDMGGTGLIPDTKTHGLQYGDKIFFHLHNVYDVLTEERSKELEAQVKANKPKTKTMKKETEKKMTIKALTEAILKINLGFKCDITEDDGVFELEFEMCLTPDEAVKVDRMVWHTFKEGYNQWDFCTRITIFN